MLIAKLGTAPAAPQSPPLREPAPVSPQDQFSTPTRGLTAGEALPILPLGEQDEALGESGGFERAAQAIGMRGQDVMQAIFSTLRTGDVQSALEIFSLLQRVIDADASAPQVSGSKADESREGLALALEYQADEANHVLDIMRKARAEYQRAMADIRRMQSQMSEQPPRPQSDIEELIAAMRKEVEALEREIRDQTNAIAQNMRDRIHELHQLQEAQPADQDLLDRAEALAAEFAAQARDGFLTHTQVSALGASLFDVPTMVGSNDRLVPSVQVSPKLVDAMVRGFESVADPAAVEVMSAQVALHVRSSANSSYKDGTLPGYGRAAVEPLLRASPGSALSFPSIDFTVPGPDAAPVTYGDRSSRRLGADSTAFQRVSAARQNYTPGDALQHTIRITPGQDTEFPLVVRGSAYFVSRPADSGPRASEYFRFELQRAEDGTLQAIRQTRDDQRKPWGPAESIGVLAEAADGSVELSIGAAPPETIDAGRQTFVMTLSGTSSVFTNEV